MGAGPGRGFIKVMSSAHNSATQSNTKHAAWGVCSPRGGTAEWSGARAAYTLLSRRRLRVVVGGGGGKSRVRRADAPPRRWARPRCPEARRRRWWRRGPQPELRALAPELGGAHWVEQRLERADRLLLAQGGAALQRQRDESTVRRGARGSGVWRVAGAVRRKRGASQAARSAQGLVWVRAERAAHRLAATSFSAGSCACHGPPASARDNSCRAARPSATAPASCASSTSTAHGGASGAAGGAMALPAPTPAAPPPWAVEAAPPPARCDPARGSAARGSGSSSLALRPATHRAHTPCRVLTV